VAIYCCAVCQLSRIQVRGAQWFSGLVGIEGRRGYKSAAVTKALDAISGPLLPPICTILWLLLVVGVLPRAWFYLTMHLVNSLFGLRAFVAIATKRVSALRKMATIQNAFRGTAQDKQRRSAILKNKAFGLVFDLAGVFINLFAVPGSMVVFKSTFSSKQMIIHCTICLPLISALSLLFGWKHIHRQRRGRPARSRGLQQQHTPNANTAGSELTHDSFGSGLSALEQSVVVERPRHGLFSSIDSSVAPG
jgi:hypothetical protein